MLVNICTEQAGATATCHSVSVSGSEPTNLVSSDPVQRSYGFRAERYVKGPVVVEIDMSRLRTRFTLEAVVMRGAVQDSSSYTADIFVSDGDQEKFIGRLVFGGPTHSNPKSINALYRIADKSIADIIPSVKGSYVNEALSANKFSDSIDMHNTLFVRRHLKSLSVKITNICGGISAGINWLEIWSACEVAPYAISSPLPSLYTGVALTDLYACPGDKTRPTTCNEHSHEEIAESVIPNDFLDQLTFEVMEDPVTLPSGNTVDLKSIHKLFDEKKQEDKIPLDPFTGISLKDFSPVINVKLRDKIKDFKTNYNGYSQYNTNITSDASEVCSNNPEEDTVQIRKKRLAYFQTVTSQNKKTRVNYRTHREVLFTSRLPFEDDSPLNSHEIIDLTLDDDSPQHTKS